MEYNNQEIKERLLEIAKQQSIKFGQDMTKEMKKNIRLEKNEKENWVRIVYIGDNIKRNAINKESFEELLKRLSPNKKIPVYDIIDEQTYVQFQFQDPKITNKVYEHYHNFFFGTLQQQAINEYLVKYINELLDEGCATGSCGHFHFGNTNGCDACDASLPDNSDSESE
ncbi:MAG: hypothetical protein ACTSRS_16675 [Candidatus Helarchaeota archaeon]